MLDKYIYIYSFLNFHLTFNLINIYLIILHTFLQSTSLKFKHITIFLHFICFNIILFIYFAMKRQRLK